MAQQVAEGKRYHKRLADPERYHAPLAPSSAYQWFECADSLNVRKRGTNEYAEEGTAAHELLGLCLICDRDPHVFIGMHIYKHWQVTEEMADAVQQCIDFIRAYLAKNPNAKLIFDKTVDPHSLIGCAPGYASGTLDVGIDNFPLEIVIIDYKHGRVSVDVEDNLQVFQYDLGYFAQYATRPYQQYRHVIAQPRNKDREAERIREDVITHSELMAYRSRLKKRITEIKRNPKHRKAGAWCDWCGAAGTCKTLAALNMKTAQQEFSDLIPKRKGAAPVDPLDMEPEDVAYIVTQAPLIEKWLKAVYAQAMANALRGHKSKYIKLVTGITNRYISDKAQVARQLLADNFQPSEFAPRKLIGIPAIESLYKKKLGRRMRKGEQALPESILRYIKRDPKPPLHIALMTDARPAVARGQEFSVLPD